MQNLSDIKKLRKQLGLTQKQLSTLAKVSQSLIAKIENNSIDPSYTLATKILDTLYSISHSKEKKSIDIMKKSIITISIASSVKEAVKLMNQHKISQLPVTHSKTIVGLVSETTLLEGLLNNKKDLKDLMTPPPPTVQYDAPLSMIHDIIKYWPIILVQKEKKYIGVISKSDLLSSILK